MDFALGIRGHLRFARSLESHEEPQRMRHEAESDIPQSRGVDDNVRVNDEGRVVPAYALYSARAAMWATFCGSVLAGGIVLAINYARLGQRRELLNTLLWSALGTAALIAIAHLPQEDRSILAPILHPVQIAVMWVVAHSIQGPAIERHRERGGSLASAWSAVGIGCICGLFMSVALIGTTQFEIPTDSGPYVEFDINNKVFYSGDATKEDASYLGHHLVACAYFGYVDGASVYVEASAGQYTMSFVVREGAWYDPEVIELFRELGDSLADSGFGRPLTIRLCDEKLESRKSLHVG
jgi:hypothetical protein